jgi:hypothetical protein
MQTRFACMVMYLRFQKMNSDNVLNRWDTVSFSSRALLHAVSYSWWGIKLSSYYITINSGRCHNVKIGPGANPSSYPMGPRDFSPESKGLGATLATHLYPVKSYYALSHSSIPPCDSMVVCWVKHKFWPYLTLFEPRLICLLSNRFTNH